jgi:uncharacterized glyoxalase superfamily protein PhnB
MTNEYRTPSDIHPCLVYTDASHAIEWLCRAFGFTSQLVVPGEGGAVRHSELSLGSGVVMVSSPRDAESKLRVGTGMLSVYVPDPDVHHAVAVEAGVRIVQPMREEEYGAKGYMALDCEGNSWYFGNYRPGAYWTPTPTQEDKGAA